MLRCRLKKVSWNHKNDENSIDCKHEIEWHGKKATIDIEANHKATYKKRNIDLKIVLTCPYADDIRINFDHQHDRKNFKNIQTSGNVQWKDDKNIAFENDMSYVPNKYTTKSLKITTPFKGYEKISSTVNTRISDDEITSHKEIKWGNNNKITSDETIKHMGNYQFDYSWRMTTPFDKVQRVSASVSNMNQNGVWKTNAEGQLNRDKAEIRSEVGLGSPKKFMLDVKTPSRYMRNMLVDFEIEGAPRDFTSKATVNHNMLDEAIMGNLKVDSKELTDIKAEFSLQTPYRVVKNVRSVFSHKRQRNTYMTDASIQVPRYKGTVTNQFTYVDWNRWNSESEIEYKPGEKIKLNTEFLMNRQGATGEFSFESPFPEAEMYKLTFNHKGNRNNFENTAELMYEPSKKISTEVMYKNIRDRIEVSAEIVTPFRELRKAGASFSHEGELVGVSRQTFNAEMNGRSISGTHDMSYDGRYNYECTTNVKTPFRGWRDIELRVKHEGEPTDFKNDISFSYDQQVISNHLEFEYDSTGVKGKIEFTSPYPALRDFKLDLNHSGTMSAFSNSGNIQYNGRRYSGNTEYRNNRRGYSAVVGVSVPEEYSFSVDHTGDYNDMVHNMELNLDGKKSTSEIIYKNNRGNIESSITLTSPYRDYNKAKVSMNHRNTGSGFITIADLESSIPGYDKFNFEVNHDDGRRGLKTSGTIRTPFEVLPTANFEVSHSGGINDFTSAGAVVINSRRYSGNVNYKNDRSGIEAGAAVQTPHNNYENQGFTVTHRNTRQGFKSTGSIDTSYPDYRNFGTEINHRGNWENFQSSIKVDTPFAKMPSTTMSISHSGDPKDFTTNMKAEYNGKAMEGTVTLKKIGGWWETDHEAMISLSSPYDQLRSFEMKTEHKDQGRQCSGKIEVTYNGEKQLDADYTSRHGNRKSLDVNVRSPRPMTLSGTMDTSGEISGDASLNWDPRSRNKNVRVEYGLKTQEGDRRLKLKTILPNRIVGIDTGYMRSDVSFAHDLDFQWDRSDSSKITYKVEASTSQRRRQSMFDWKLDVKTPYGPLEMTLNNNHVPNRCVTDLTIKGTEELSVKHEVVQNRANWEDFTMTTTIKHPQMKSVSS